jgi:hypothetical protein
MRQIHPQSAEEAGGLAAVESKSAEDEAPLKAKPHMKSLERRISIMDLIADSNRNIEDVDFSPLFKSEKKAVMTDSSLAKGSRTGRTFLHWKELMVPVVTLAVYVLVGYIFYNQEEGWGLIDSAYFAVLTITTVGYGDLVPTSDGSKVFTIIYAFLGIGLVGTALGQVASWIYILQDKYSKQATLMMLKESLKTANKMKKVGGAAVNKSLAGGRMVSQKLINAGSSVGSRMKDLGKSAGAQSPLKLNKKLGELKNTTIGRTAQNLLGSAQSAISTSKDGVMKASTAVTSAFGCLWRLYQSKVYTVLMIVAPLVLYILFGIGLGQIEGWGILDSVYVSCITLTGIGYGDITPSTQSGRLFAVFYMPIGIVVTLNVVSTLA